MRRLKVFVAASADGYIAGRDGDRSWQFRDADYGFDAFFGGVDTVLMGRRTYEIARSADRWPYASRKTVVFTRDRGFAVSSPDTVATVRAPADVVAELRAREGKDLWLAGGADLIRGCLDARLIDDVTLSIHPLMLGAGTPLAAGAAVSTALTLVAERRYPSGLMQLSYRVSRD